MRKGLSCVEVRFLDPHAIIDLTGKERANAGPIVERHPLRGLVEKTPHVRAQAADMDVELVLRPRVLGIDDQRDVVARRRISVRALEERARPPGGGEVIRRLGRLKERVLDAGRLARRRQDEVVRLQRAKHGVAAVQVSAGEVDLETGKRDAQHL